MRQKSHFDHPRVLVSLENIFHNLDIDLDDLDHLICLIVIFIGKILVNLNIDS